MDSGAARPKGSDRRRQLPTHPLFVVPDTVIFLMRPRGKRERAWSDKRVCMRKSDQSRGGMVYMVGVLNEPDRDEDQSKAREPWEGAGMN